MDLHHEPSPSHGEMQNSYTLGALESLRVECELELRDRIHDPTDRRLSTFNSYSLSTPEFGMDDRTRTG